MTFPRQNGSTKDAPRTERRGPTREMMDGRNRLEGRKEMFYVTTHSTHFIYGYMASDIW